MPDFLFCFSNSCECGSSWHTLTKVLLYKTWPRSTISRLSPGSDLLPFSILKTPSKGTMGKMSPPHSQMIPRDITTDRCPGVAWEAVESSWHSQELMVWRLMMMTITATMKKNHKYLNTYLFLLFCFLPVCLSLCFGVSAKFPYSHLHLTLCTLTYPLTIPHSHTPAAQGPYMGETSLVATIQRSCLFDLSTLFVCFFFHVFNLVNGFGLF